MNPKLSKSLSLLAACGGVLLSAAAQAQTNVAALQAKIDQLADTVEPEVIANRRYLHQHPELSNREFETEKYLVKKLKAMGYEVQSGIAHTGVVAVLRGGKPGPVVALRSDMDALPVAEEVDLPFKSTVRSTYDGKDVGVMHACGHDAHMGILLGVAHIFAQMKDELPGTVKLIFQPAEEGTPKGEEGGAKLMVKEGVLTSAPQPEAIFGLHIMTKFETGQLAYRAGGTMASADDFTVVVHGKQTHGAMPWNGIDPVVIGSQIVLGLQTITSRQMDLTKAPVVVTVGKFDSGVRNNIIPDSATLKGTLRALDEGMRQQLHDDVQRTASNIAAASGATVDVDIGQESAYPVTYNDPKLTARMLPTLRRVGGAGLVESPVIMGAEDFSFYQQQIPGLFVFVGVRKPGASLDEYAPNHSPRFKVDESGLKLGVRTLANLTVDYMAGTPVVIAQ
ncbi:amidohydrolase [Nevskia soli]|uniref:amidohydrolase n=1 Tax=Nevskia soli TaxID=418856 RepID=UPI0004A6D294|nr:amidohydrolase [Nevskia soli]